LELLQQHVAIRIRRRDLLGPGDGASHAFGAFGEYQPGTIGHQQLAPLQAHGFRHRQGQGNTRGSGDEGEGDAGVAAGRFDQFLARAQQTTLLGIPDHRRADAALDRIGRIASLDLGEKTGRGAVGDAVELDQRRAADRKGIVCVPSGHANLLNWERYGIKRRLHCVGSPAAIQRLAVDLSRLAVPRKDELLLCLFALGVNAVGRPAAGQRRNKLCISSYLSRPSRLPTMTTGSFTQRRTSCPSSPSTPETSSAAASRKSSTAPSFPKSTSRPHGIVTSVITSRSVKELQLQVGTEVLALVKATEVSIAKL
jgi:hypothetical protein